MIKATQANRGRGLGTREKVSLRRLNLESNTYVLEEKLGISLYSYPHLN
jgi:hypothetical protein